MPYGMTKVLNNVALAYKPILTSWSFMVV